MTDSSSEEVAGGPALQLDNVSVRFGDFLAVDGVSLEWPVGRIHALVGQNGAGKSTLARVMAGLQETASGRMGVKGEAVQDGDYLGARRAGVDMVHQHSSLIPTMTVAEALETTDGANGLRSYRWSALVGKWRERLAASGVDVDLEAKVSELSVEAVQSLEVARANPGPGGILILDEPTAVLPPAGVTALFALLRDLRAQGVTIVVVLHKIGEVREIADTVTVLRRGKRVMAPTPIDQVTDTELSEAIIGSSLAARATRGTGGASTGGAANPDGDAGIDQSRPAGLALEACHTAGTNREIALTDVSLIARPGELVGIAGVDGNGQRGIVELLCGVTSPAAGSVRLLDQDVTNLDVGQRRQLGLHVMPFDRFAEGVSGSEPLWRNVSLWDAEKHRRWSWLPFVSVKDMRAEATTLLDRFGVEYQGLDQPAETLSGGNAQRLILAREFEGVTALVIAQPTRGLDIGGIDFVWDSVRKLVDEGIPVLVISSDLDELLANCDRLYVVRGGTVALEAQAPFDLAQIGDAMTGGTRTGGTRTGEAPTGGAQHEGSPS